MDEIETNELIEMYKKVQSFLTSLDKQEKEITKGKDGK